MLLTLHKGFLSVAHDEYWSWEMRQYITGARDAGLNLGFFGANDIYWQIRLEPSPITGDPNRTEVCYKDSWPLDPMAANPATYNLITNRWRDDHASLPGLPEDALIGEMYNEKEPMSVDVVIGNTGSFIFNGSGLSPGGHLTNLVGYEADRLYFNAPVGTQQITHSPYIFSDGTLNFSDITFYQAASGAAVFATGSMQWNWGLAQGIQSTLLRQSRRAADDEQCAGPPDHATYSAQRLYRAARHRHQQHLQRQHPARDQRAGRSGGQRCNARANRGARRLQHHYHSPARMEPGAPRQPGGHHRPGGLQPCGG